jgi:DNA repair protein RecN (Recombination protein N)
MLALKVVVAQGPPPTLRSAQDEAPESQKPPESQRPQVSAQNQGANLGHQAGNPTPTLVFDEIDTGIGGRAAEAVGRKLKSLARVCQVLCITHLPQVASFADQHYLIEKREVGGRARTRVRRLELAERTEELARMLSGAKVTDVALKNAAQMLKANA